MPTYLTAPSLSHLPTIKHGFFTRQYGIFYKGDLERSELSRHVIAKALGASSGRLLGPRQIHSATALVVDAPFSGEHPQADALVTTTKGLLLSVQTADCVPILLASDRTDIVAAVHAGWRGAYAGIVENTVALMNKLGARRLLAALGPCIWQDSYEVGEEFYQQLGPNSSFFVAGHRANHWQFDLPAYVISRLQQCGVELIEPSPADTYSNKDLYFSYRRYTHHCSEEPGGNLSVIGIF